MTNPELKKALEDMLKEGKADSETVAILQDASIHAAMIADIALEVADLTYTLLVMAHTFQASLLGLAGNAGNAAFKLETQPSTATQEEKDKLNAILKDLKIDL